METASKIEEKFIEEIAQKLQKGLIGSKWKIGLDPTRKGIILQIEKNEKKLTYEIFLMNGFFLILSRKPEEKLLGKIQNNFKSSFLVRSFFDLIIKHLSQVKKKNFFNHEEYPYPNGPLDNRIFKRGGWSDNCVLFSKQDQAKKRVHNVNVFYVYAYLDPRKPGVYDYQDVKFSYQPIYVGKGQGNRSLDHLKHFDREYFQNKHFQNKLYKIAAQFSKEEIEKHVVIIKRNLTEPEAFDFERDLIAKIGRVDLKTGPLCNWTDGGEGLSNPNEKTRKKMSKALSGKNNPMFGKKFSPEVPDKISKAVLGEKNGFFGKHHSEQTKKRWSKIRKGVKHSQEAKEKIAKASLGRKHSIETREKLSRINLGEKNPSAKLTKKQTHQIKKLLKLKFKQRVIAGLFNISQATVSNIKCEIREKDTRK